MKREWGFGDRQIGDILPRRILSIATVEISQELPSISGDPKQEDATSINSGPCGWSKYGDVLKSNPSRYDEVEIGDQRKEVARWQ